MILVGIYIPLGFQNGAKTFGNPIDACRLSRAGLPSRKLTSTGVWDQRYLATESAFHYQLVELSRGDR